MSHFFAASLKGQELRIWPLSLVLSSLPDCTAFDNLSGGFEDDRKDISKRRWCCGPHSLM